MSFESLTLTEIRQELQSLNIDVSTGTLRGEARKAALLERLQQAKPQVSSQPQKPRTLSSTSSSRIPMNELRSKCEELGISTLTHGLTGEARYQELMKRVSFTEEPTEDVEELKDEPGDTPGWRNTISEDIEPSINWGGNHRVFIDDDDEDEGDESEADELYHGDNIIDDSDEDNELYFDNDDTVINDDDSHNPNNDDRGCIQNLDEDSISDSHVLVNEELDDSIHPHLPMASMGRDLGHVQTKKSEEEYSAKEVTNAPTFPSPSLSNQVQFEQKKTNRNEKEGQNSKNDDEEEEEEDDEGAKDYDDFSESIENKRSFKLDISKTMNKASSDNEKSKTNKQDSPAPLQQQSMAGTSYFASILTPRLSSEELARRLRVIKREIRGLMENRANAIGYRSHGQCADLDVLTLEKQHNKVQAELKRIRSEEHEVSMHRSRLVDAGKKMSFADLQFKLTTMEVALFKQLNDVRKKIVKEENMSPAHGTDAEMAMNAQIVVLTRALAVAKEEEEKERLSRYEIETEENQKKQSNANDKSEGDGSAAAATEKENVWHPPGGPPLILDNPISASSTDGKKKEQSPHPHPSSSSSPSPLSSKVNKKLTPGDLLLQKALKLISEHPKSSKKKKIPIEKLNEIEKFYLESIKYARVSLESDPGLLPKVLMHWGNFLFQEKDNIEGARQVFIEAYDNAEKCGISRVLASVSAEYAGFLSKCREVDKAEQVYLKGLSVDSTHPRLLGNYARLLTSRGEYARADSLFCQALDNAPLHGPTMINRAQLLKTLGKVEQAEELLRKAATECSDLSHRAQGANNLANFLWRVKGDLAGAKKAYIDGIVQSKQLKGGGDKLLQRNYAMFLSRNKEMRGNTLPVADLPGREGGLGVLEEAEDPYDEMSTLDASVVKRILASNKAHQLNETFEED